MALYIGTAGWNVPRASPESFASSGTHLQRYALVLTGVEINSSFYRSHRLSTYRRWAESTPAGFRFAVKVPRELTHELRLRRPARALDTFLAETSGLGEKRGPLLVQLPPSLEFDRSVARRFFRCIRERHDGPIVCEPRHISWFARRAESLLTEHRIARVAADPPRAPEGRAPGGWTGIAYVRLHGSPRVYWSRYSPQEIDRVTAEIRGLGNAEVWCVFDNTAAGAAVENALELLQRQAQNTSGTRCCLRFGSL